MVKRTQKKADHRKITRIGWGTKKKTTQKDSEEGKNL